MANEFAELVKLAVKSRWCTDLYCTTCGNRQFRDGLTQIDNGLGGHLADLLSNLDIDEYTRVGKWLDCLRIAFVDLPFAPQRDGVLKNWLSYARTNVRFADGILYYIVRYLPPDDIRQSWISSCVDLALESKDPSLVESLVWVLGPQLVRHPNLVDVAHGLTAASAKVQTALRKTGNFRLA